MRNNGFILSAVLLAAAAAAHAQGGEPADLPGLRGIYIKSGPGWMGLPGNPLLAFERGTARWLLGFGHDDAVAQIPGPHAAVQTSNSKPIFYARGFPPTSGIYLVRQVQKWDYRELRMAVTGNFDNWSHFREKDLVAIDVKPVAGEVVSITPRENLKGGEYSIVSVYEPQHRDIRVRFDFGISAQ